MNINFKMAQIPWALAIVAVAMVAFAAACGGSEPEDLIFNVTIEHDAWDVADDIIKVKQGDHVTVNVQSDVQGGFHLHGYDLYNEVAPDAPMSFDFVADATGNFEIQFHKFTLASDAPAADEHVEGDEHEDGAETELSLGSLQVFPR
jgi:heme/copper-type cytochrome/quinol oxidase subunit 2